MLYAHTFEHLLVSNCWHKNVKFVVFTNCCSFDTYTAFISTSSTCNRSNFLGTKFIIYDTQPPYNSAQPSTSGRTSRRFYSKKVSPKVPTGTYDIAHVTYDLNVLGTRGPRKMNCIMHSIPVSALAPGGSVPGAPELLPRSLEDSFRSILLSKAFKI